MPHRIAKSFNAPCQAVVIWIDWYAYHVARFTGLQSAFGSDGQIVGIELVGGVGVHAGLKFREELPADLPVHTLLPEASWSKTSKVTLSKLLWKRLSDLNPQVVLVPGYYNLPALTAALWARRHKRVSVLMTESTAHDHARSSWKEKLKSLLVNRLFDWAVTGGTAHVRYLRQLGFPADRIASFYDVVGNDKLRDAVTSLRQHSDAALHGLPSEYFLYVGRLSAEKNVSTLLRAWIAYRGRGGSRPLVLVGDGPEAASLRELASSSAFADDVHFAGHKSSRELWPYFAFSAAFVLPSTREPWGLVVNEAMAASLPVFVSETCGCAENLVHPGQNGYTFSPANVEQLSAHFDAFDHLRDDQRAGMGAASGERIAAYSPENFGEQIARIAAQATASSRYVAPDAPAAEPGKADKDIRRRAFDA